MTTWRNDDLEQVCCDFCGKSHSRDVIVRPDSLRVVECLGCGLAFISPRPKASQIVKLYEAEYFTKQGENGASIGYPDYFSLKNQPFLQRLAREKHAIAQKFICFQKAKCLEVGCAAGEFSSLLTRKGAKVLGIDLSKRAIEEAVSRYPGTKFRQGDLTALNEGTFDAIFAFEVIEHVTSPVVFLKAAANRLNSRGFLILSTPNYECGKTVGVEQWFGFQSSFEHLYFFTPDVLSKCAARAGLTTIDWMTDRESGIMNANAPSKQDRLRLIKDGLRAVGLLKAAQALRRSLKPEPSSYHSHGRGHNLLMILQKTI